MDRWEYDYVGAGECAIADCCVLFHFVFCENVIIIRKLAKN